MEENKEHKERAAKRKELMKKLVKKDLSLEDYPYQLINRQISDDLPMGSSSANFAYFATGLPMEYQFLDIIN